MIVKEWELHEDHDVEVKGLLTENGCMDSEGRIRRWKKNMGTILKDSGHTSLNFYECACRNLKDKKWSSFTSLEKDAENKERHCEAH
jgi:hypothetical protein